jgi:YD repeat-containing protein
MARYSRNHHLNIRNNISGFLFFAFTMAVLCSVSARAQGVGATMDAETATPMPGTGHDYQHLLSETVDPSSGQVSFRFDQPVPPSRGFTLPVALTYTSAYVHLDQSGGGITLNPTVDLMWISGSMGSGGWKIPLPRLQFSYWNQTYSYGDPSPTSSITCEYVTNNAFTDKTGTVHNLQLGYSLSGPETGTPIGSSSPSNCYEADYVYPGAQSARNGAQVQILDGGDSQFSAFFENPNYYGSDSAGYSIDNPSVTIQDRSDGTTYFFQLFAPTVSQSGGSGTQTYYPTSITDRNGNTEVMGNNTYEEDTVGRPAGWSGFFGYTLSSFTIPSYSIPMEGLFAAGANGCSSGTFSFTQSLSVTAVSQVSLPDGFSYELYYGSNNPTDSSVTNPYGLINEIIYPSGGWVKYLWTTTVGGTYSQMMNYNATAATNPSIYGIPAQCEYLYATPVVSKRMVSYDGVHIAETQTFTYSTTWPAQTPQNLLIQPNWTSKSTSVLTTDNVSGLSFLKTYSYSPMALASTPFVVSSFASQLPVEQTVTTYSGATTGTTALDTTTKGWFNQFLQACEFHKVPSGVSAGHFLNYQYNTPQPSDDKEYDFGQISNPPSVCFNAAYPTMPYAPSSPTPIRETALTFQLADVYRPCKSTTLNSSGTSIAETDLYYDGGTTLCTSGPGSTTPPISGPPLPSGTHNETLYGPSSTRSRGNVTKSVQINSLGTSPSTTYTFDETGQPLSMIDPRTYTTQYSFTDNPPGGNSPGNSNAYLTKITYPTVNGVTLQKTFGYNYPTGELATSTDVNNQTTTSYSYADPLLRLTDIYDPPSPQNGNTQPHTHYYHVDGAGAYVTTTNPIGVVSTAYLDGMGHVTSTVLTDPEGNDIVATTYDGEGHVQSTTNPYRTTSDLTYGITSYLYDALGRKIDQCQPNNGGVNSITCAPSTSYQSWTYSDPTVTFKDENGNQWQRTSDAFGRLKQVVEPGALVTNYTYDGLNNLLTVSQLGNAANGDTPRTRAFNYDSLSHLLCASNPENSNAACPATATGGYIAGTTGYSYDANSNVSTKTDTRGITTQFGYDALNRVASKTYPSDTTGTAISCFQYDTSAIPGAAGNLYGRLTNSWTQPTNTSCTGSGGNNAPVAGSYLALKSILAYDAMGRPTSAQQQQCIGSSCSAPSPYSLSMVYDLTGNMTILTNSVGASGQPLTLTNYFDAASRPCLTTSSWNDNSPPNLFQVNPSTNASPLGYAPFGSLQNWYMGSFSSSASTACSSTPSSPINITQGYTNRLWVNSISATGQIP